MITGIFVLVIVATGFLTWLFWEHDFDVAFVVALLALAVELIVAVIVVPAYLGGSYSCYKVAEKLGVEHDYGFFTGCFVKDESGKWYNYNQQRIMK